MPLNSIPVARLECFTPALVLFCEGEEEGAGFMHFEQYQSGLKRVCTFLLAKPCLQQREIFVLSV